MPEDKIRVSARIPKELYDICLQRYDNITNAINAGLELLRAQSEDKTKTNEDTCQQNKDTSVQDEDTSQLVNDTRLHSEDERQTNEDDNSKANIQELKARIEEKDKQIEEKDRHIETLKKDLDVSQETHRNYMLQVQSLINQRALEAPGAKKPWWQFW
jgi:predicted RNase H-like nuclease (RuvC/YqgF family)